MYSLQYKYIQYNQYLKIVGNVLNVQANIDHKYRLNADQSINLNQKHPHIFDTLYAGVVRIEPSFILSSVEMLASGATCWIRIRPNTLQNTSENKLWETQNHDDRNKDIR